MAATMSESRLADNSACRVSIILRSIKMKKSLAYISLLICALFTLSALAADLPTRKDKGYVSPESVAGATTVDAAKAHELWEKRAVFVDVRKEGQFEAGRIPGAINLPYGPEITGDQPFNSAALESHAAKDQAVVIYCNAKGCDRSSWGAALAAEWGWTKVYYFRLGYPSWKTAGYPVE
jgi:rhodanese-related sulfurtransferase